MLDFRYGFNAGTADNGNVASITNNRDTQRSQSFTYDELNRLDLAYTQATSGANCWGLDHGYDVWGNLLSISQKPTHNCTSATLGVGVNTKNQINSDPGFVYDAAGNLTNTPNPGGLALQYDAENRMTFAVGVMYTGVHPERSRGDGDGRCVHKSSGKLCWYGPDVSGCSDRVAESDLGGNITDECNSLPRLRFSQSALTVSAQTVASKLPPWIVGKTI